jgi:hypothetical protein
MCDGEVASRAAECVAGHSGGRRGCCNEANNGDFDMHEMI